MTDLPLFAATQMNAPRPAALDARREADHQAARHAGTQRERVLQFVRSRARHGATDGELAEALGLILDTARPRRNELAAAGAIIDSGRRRPSTIGGRPATVWVAREFAEPANRPKAAGGIDRQHAGDGAPAAARPPAAISSHQTDQAAPSAAGPRCAPLPAGPSTTAETASPRCSAGDLADAAGPAARIISREISEPAAGAPPAPKCRRCGSTQTIEIPITFGRTRLDCKRCGFFVAWGRWYAPGDNRGK